MRLSNAGVAIATVAAFLVARTIIPIIRPEYLAVLTTVLLMMLVQLAVVAGIARLKLSLRDAGLWALVTAIVFGGLLAWLLIGKPRLDPALMLTVRTAHQLSLILVAVFLGVTVSYIIRDRNLLLPVAIVAALVDFWNVYIGPLGHVLATKPSVVQAVAVQMPTTVPGIPMPMIGMGDFVFLAMYFSVIYRFGMRAKSTFWWGYAILTITMLAVIVYGLPIPALVPMAIAVIGANWKCFHLKREELQATIIVSLVVAVLLGASGVYMLRKQIANQSERPRTVDTRPQHAKPAKP